MIVLILKIIGLAALMCAGMFGLFLLMRGLSRIINNPKVDAVLNPPPTPYNYKPEELWEAPSYWKNWEKNV
jgi:hypothetical protein